MGRVLPEWLLGALAMAAGFTAVAMLFVYIDVFVVRLALGLFAGFLVLIVLFHPEFILRRLGASLIAAGAIPHGASAGLASDAADGALRSLFGWFDVNGPPTLALLGIGFLLLLLDEGKRLAARLLPAHTRIEPFKYLSAVPMDGQGRFLFATEILLQKAKGAPLRIEGADLAALVPWSRARLPDHDVTLAVSSPRIEGAFDVPSEMQPVDVSTLQLVLLRARFVIESPLLAWAFKEGNLAWLRRIARWTIVRRVGARFTLKTDGFAPYLSTLVRGRPSRP